MAGMMGSGTLLSEYIARLQAIYEKHGDLQCWDAGGSDYPEPARQPYVNLHASAYTPAGVVVLS